MEMKVMAAHVVDGRVVAIPRERVDAQVAEGGDMLWVHIESPSREHVDNWIKPTLGVCPLTVHDLMYEHMRAGIEQHAKTLAFIVIAAEQGDELDYIPVGCFVSANRLVTVAIRPVIAIQTLFKGWLDDPDDIGYDAPCLLHGVLDAIVDDYFPVLDRLHDRAEDLEDSVFQAAKLDPSAPLSLKRELLVMRKQIGPLRDNLNSLMRFGAPIIPASKLPDFNDLLNHCLRLSENIDLGRDIVSSIIDAQLGVVSNRLNEVMRTLTVVSTLLMVCSLISGIYGMNFERMPELKWVYGYPFALGLMAVASLVVMWLFRRKRWI